MEKTDILRNIQAVVLIVILITSSTALVTAFSPTQSLKRLPQRRDSTILLEEDFEEGIMPPEGWTKIDYNYNKQWMIVNDTEYPDYVANGTYAGAIFRDTISSQNERLKSPEVYIDDNAELVQLSFWVYSWTIMTGATLQVIANTGTRQDTLWDMILDENWPTIEYRQVLLNISQYAGQTVVFTWKYVGMIGPNVGLDDIVISEGPLPAPPVFDISIDHFSINKISATITNIQTEYGGNATNVSWEIHVTGYGLFQKFNRTENGTIPLLCMGESAPIQLAPFYGLGTMNVTVTVTALRAQPVSKSAHGFVLFIVIYLGT